MDFHPQSKDAHVGLIVESKLSVDEDVRVWACLSGLRWTGDLSGVDPASVTAGTDPTPTHYRSIFIQLCSTLFSALTAAKSHIKQLLHAGAAVASVAVTRHFSIYCRSCLPATTQSTEPNSQQREHVVRAAPAQNHNEHHFFLLFLFNL